MDFYLYNWFQIVILNMQQSANNFCITDYFTLYSNYSVTVEIQQEFSGFQLQSFLWLPVTFEKDLPLLFCLRLLFPVFSQYDKKYIQLPGFPYWGDGGSPPTNWKVAYLPPPPPPFKNLYFPSHQKSFPSH